MRRPNIAKSPHNVLKTHNHFKPHIAALYLAFDRSCRTRPRVPKTGHDTPKDGAVPRTALKSLEKMPSVARAPTERHAESQVMTMA